jgi:hypothetical protein
MQRIDPRQPVVDELSVFETTFAETIEINLGDDEPRQHEEQIDA